MDELDNLDLLAEAICKGDAAEARRLECCQKLKIQYFDTCPSHIFSFILLETVLL